MHKPSCNGVREEKREKELKCYPYWVGYAVATCGGIGYILKEKSI